jgi:hypothetical protein
MRRQEESKNSGNPQTGRQQLQAVPRPEPVHSSSGFFRCVSADLKLTATMGVLNILRKHGQRFFAISLRLLSVLQLLTGLGFIGFSCYLHFPPEDSLTL